MEGLSHPEAEISVADLMDRAQLYYTNLPYHNWPHAIEVYEDSRTKAELCRANGICVDVGVVAAGALFHDAGYHIDPLEHGFQSRESFSCYIAAGELRALGLAPNRTMHVLEVIASTELGVQPVSLEARIVCQADLNNVASDNIFVFLKKLLLLLEENKILTGRSMDIRTFAGTSHAILAGYLEKDFSLGQFDLEPNGKSWFANRALENIRTLLSPKLLEILDALKRP